MQAYKFDSNGYYSGTGTVQKSPFGNESLLPKNATLVQPVFQAGKKCKWTGTEWAYEEINYVALAQEAEAKEAAKYASYYEQNPTLATRVRQYAAILTAYGLAATATSDQIAAAIQADTTKMDAEKTTAAASLLTLIHDIEINWNEVNPGAGLTAWTIMPKLIKYLPTEGEDE